MSVRILASLVFATFIGSGCIFANDEETAEGNKKWESSIQAFEKQDKEKPPPKDAILLVGSSSFTKWKTAAEDLKPLPVLNRGFGGSDMPAVLANYKRLVLPYHPRTVVLYEGGNDIARGTTPEGVLENVKTFVANVNRDLPETQIVILSIHLAPVRAKYEAKVRELNRLVAEFCKTAKNVTHVDATTPLLKDDKPQPEIYGKDQLHLNTDGYKLWTAIIKPVLEKVHAVKEPAKEK